MKDTWLQQVIDALGMELLVNNSWSGSCVFQPRMGAASVGYGDRAVNLHNDHTGEEPDIILIQLGGNDFAYYKDTFGKATDFDYTALIKDNGNGTFTYAEPNTTCEAFAIMLHKIHNRYQEAEIYYLTSYAKRDPDYTGDSYPGTGQPTEYNADLIKVVQYFGLEVIDLEDCIPKEAELFDLNMADKRAHPNALGMDRITNKVLSDLLGTEAEIRHVSSKDGTVIEQAVLLGGSYRAEVNLQQDQALVVTMNGEDITDSAYSNGTIHIEQVTGDVSVHTTIKRDPKNFRWEIQNDTLVSVGQDDNPATMLTGTITDDMLDNVSAQFEEPAVLRHDLPWEIAWQFGGDWRGCVFTDYYQRTNGRRYLVRTVGGQLCFGTWPGDQSDNYGVNLSKLDGQTHTYRLVNRIADDGSNMVWLYLDGVEMGPMNHYFINSNDQGKTSDWISGKDFQFSYLGSDKTPISSCRLEYLQVRECIHTYKNGICTGCGKTSDLIITQQPESISADRFEEVVVSAAAEGAGVVYQWYYRCAGEADFRISSSTGDTFRTVMSSDLHGCEVYCVITDETGNSVTSDIALLTLSSEAAPETPPTRIPGDINGDGEVNNKDLTHLFRYLTGYDVEIN